MRIAIFLTVLLCAPLVFGVGIETQSPLDGATVDVTTEKFTFTAAREYRTTFIDTCSLVLDGEKVKTLPINGNLGGMNRQLTLQAEAGTHTWGISCQAGEQELTSEEWTVIVIETATSVVDVTSSGVTRGSLLHSFEMENTPEQEAVFVSRVAAGDYISISLSIPPSTFEREFYIQNRGVQDRKNYVRATNDNKAYQLFEGENTTVTLGSSSVIGSFLGMDGTRMNFMFYPNVVIPDEPETPEEPADEPEEPEEVEEPEVPEEIPEPEPATPDDPPAPTERRGFFSWVASLLTGLFGA